MKTVVTAMCAALLVALALGAVLYALAGDWVGAGFFTFLTVCIAVVLWIGLEPTEGIKR